LESAHWMGIASIVQGHYLGRCQNIGDPFTYWILPDHENCCQNSPSKRSCCSHSFADYHGECQNIGIYVTGFTCCFYWWFNPSCLILRPM
jgi:hypothetical protein